MSGAIDDELMFDTFISYDKADQKWVTETLIRKLEDANIKVCWDDRDFEPGKTVIENKLNAICSSSSTVVILSPDYVENEDLWVQLNKRCGYDDKEVIEEFQVIPVIATNCKVPNVFAPLWKLDWTNELAKTFFWDKLIQTVKAFSNEAKIHDNSLGKRQSRSITKKSNRMADDRAANHFKSSKDNLECEQPTIVEMVENESQDRSHTIPKDPKQETLHFNSKLEKEKSEAGKENRPSLKHDRSMKQCSEDNSKDRHRQQDFISDGGEENRAISRETNVRKLEAVQYDSSVISKSEVNEMYLSNNHSYEEGETERDNKLLETMDPRILSIFSPEDDDLSRQDIEELTFKIEDIYLEDSLPEPMENDNNEPESCETKNINVNTNLKLYKTSSITKRSKYRRFASQQEQMLILDFLQEKESIIRRKFEKCCDYERKRVYKRLLERFGKAIFSTVNGENDVDLLASLPLSDLSLGETRGCKCCCCDQLFHSERALQMHINDCVKEAWISLMNGPVHRTKR